MGERQIVPGEWVKEAASPSQTMMPNYGFLWWNNSTGKYQGVPTDAFAAMGRFDNDMLIVPSMDLIVILANRYRSRSAVQDQGGGVLHIGNRSGRATLGLGDRKSCERAEHASKTGKGATRQAIWRHSGQGQRGANAGHSCRARVLPARESNPSIQIMR